MPVNICAYCLPKPAKLLSTVGCSFNGKDSLSLQKYRCYIFLRSHWFSFNSFEYFWKQKQYLGAESSWYLFAGQICKITSIWYNVQTSRLNNFTWHVWKSLFPKDKKNISIYFTFQRWYFFIFRKKYFLFLF